MAVDVSKYSKFIVAAVAAVVAFGAVAADGSISGEDVVTVLVAVASAAGVYAVPNK